MTESQHSGKQDLRFYAQLVDQLPGLIVVMDTQSRFLNSNHHTACLFGYHNVDSMLGIDAYDMRCPASESANDFINQDKHVIEKAKEITILDIHRYADGNSRILLTKKKPLYLDKQLSGVICFCTELGNHDLSHISSTLMRSDQKYLGKSDSRQRSYVVNTLLSDSTLSKREKDCIFYMLRGFTMKETAKKLGISWRTVESYMNNVKFKWGCENRKDLIDCAVTNGFLNYVPSDILSSCLSVTLPE